MNVELKVDCVILATTKKRLLV